jgi:hypothetical protein
MIEKPLLEYPHDLPHRSLGQVEAFQISSKTKIRVDALHLPKRWFSIDVIRTCLKRKELAG